MSHSSPSPEAQRRLKRFVKSLSSGVDAVDVLLDKNEIQSGDQWRDAINAMLAECDAAVILVTPDALASPWVLKESTILRWRHDQNPGFPVIPVVAGGVDRSELENNRLWTPLDLPAIQFPPGGSPAPAAASLKSTFASLDPGALTPLKLITDDIARFLAEASPLYLRAALTHLDETVPFDLTDQRERFANAIARWILRQPPPALDRMADTLTRLGRTFPGDQACRILELIAPMWIELDAASWLARANWRRPDLRDVAITCRWPAETVQQYIERAHLTVRPPPHCLLNGVTGGAQVDDIVAELRAVLRPLLKAKIRRDWTDAELDDYLGRTDRFYVALPLPDDREVIVELQQRYERVTFVFFVPPEPAQPDPPRPVGTGVAWVDPTLSPVLEERVYSDRINALAKFLY